jgi:hypothetical protein
VKGPDYDENVAFPHDTPEESLKRYRAKLLGTMRSAANEYGLTAETRKKLWAIFCGEARPMQANPVDLGRLIDFMREQHAKGVDLNQDDAA